MNVALEDWNKQEAARLEAATKADLERRSERENRLRPVFETARFVGFSGTMPTNEPYAIDAQLANFEGKTKFSLFIPVKDSEQLTKDRDYLVGFSPMMLDEYFGQSASMDYFANAMARPSPIMGELKSAQPIPSGIVKRAP